MYNAIFPKHWSTFKKLMWLQLTGGGVKWETATGNPVTFTAKAAALRQLVVSMTPQQDLHGYSNPWPAGGGKNKLDKDTNVLNKAINASGVIVDSGGSNPGNYTDLIAVNAGQTYTLSAVSGTGTQWSRRVHAYDSNGDWVRQIDAISTSSGIAEGTPYTITFTPETGDSYIRYSYPKLDYNAQLELGSATSYAPYSNICPITGYDSLTVYQSGEDTSDPTTIPVTIPTPPGTVYSGTLDVVTGVLTVTHKKITLNGSETSWSTINNRYEIYVENDIDKATKTSSTNIIVISDRFKSAGVQYRDSIADGEIAKLVNTNRQISMNAKYIYPTLDEFKASLAENPMELVYRLETPLTYQLTPTEVSSLLGDNVLWSNANGDLTVTYRSN